MDILNTLFGCTHKQLSFPITLRNHSIRGPKATYVVCLDCGAELPYDWNQMKVVRNVRKGSRRAPAAAQPQRAA
jgi:hypothetical protein